MTVSTITTKYGRARLNDKHYRISSEKEGNLGKYVHRLVFEEFYQCEIPDDWVIHHEDGDPTNNEIWNLVPMTVSEHSTLHTKQMSEEITKRFSELHKGIPKSESHKKKIAETICLKNNTTGYYRVRKEHTNGKLGYRYRWWKNGKLKSISRKNIPDLKKEVLARGLEWFEIKDGKRVD